VTEPTNVPPSSALARLALILGLAGLIASWIGLGEDVWFGVLVGVVLSVLAILFGVAGARRRVGRGLSIVGLVIGVIGLPWAGLTAIGVAFD
jgi:hypothetical protein